MANGQQKGEETVEAFKNWKASMELADYKQYIYRGQLKRGDLAKILGCGTSAFRQNPALEKLLKDLESHLRTEKILPQKITETDSTDTEESKAKEYDQSARKRVVETKRIGQLEAEVLTLKARIKECEKFEAEVVALKAKIKKDERFKEVHSAMMELGVLPR